jgi:hypothetical protein
MKSNTIGVILPNYMYVEPSPPILHYLNSRHFLYDGPDILFQLLHASQMLLVERQPYRLICHLGTARLVRFLQTISYYMCTKWIKKR